MDTRSENRQKWVAFANMVALPVLLRVETMPIEQHKDAGRETSSRAEALSRVLAGLSSWFALPPDDLSPSEEILVRNPLYGAAIAAIERFFNDAHCTRQSVIDAGYFSQAFLRCPSLFYKQKLPTRTRITQYIKSSRMFCPIANNWIVMAGLSEAFLYTVRGLHHFDPMRLEYAIRTTNDWYKGDGIYGDGKFLQNDYYNSIVVHPGLHDILKAVKGYHSEWDAFAPKFEERFARYSVILERMISPEGTYPIVGRSALYKLGCFHALAYAVHQGLYPVNSTPVQHALTACLDKQLPTLMNGEWLAMNFMRNAGLELAETYVSTGSLYAICLVLPLLGIPEKHSFWSSQFEGWTQHNLWGGKSAPRDKCIDY